MLFLPFIKSRHHYNICPHMWRLFILKFSLCLVCKAEAGITSKTSSSLNDVWHQTNQWLFFSDKRVFYVLTVLLPLFMTKVKVNFLEKTHCACWSPSGTLWQQSVLSVSVFSGLWLPYPQLCPVEKNVWFMLEFSWRSDPLGQHADFHTSTTVLNCIVHIHWLFQCLSDVVKKVKGIILTLMIEWGNISPYALP